MMRRGIFALVLLAVGAGCFWLGQRGAQAIERLLTARVEHGLAVLGIDWARVEADGLRLALHGHAPDASVRALAVETARATARYAHVIDHTTVALAPPRGRKPVLVELMRDGREVTMTGRFHGEAMRRELEKQLDEAAPKLELRDLTGTNAARPGGGWGPEIPIAALTVARVPDAYVRVEPGAVHVEGLAQDEAGRRALTDELLALAGETVRLSVNLREPARVAVPFAFTAVKEASGGIRAELCHARDAEEAVRLEAALGRLGVAPGEQRCPVALGGPPGAWPDAVEAGLDALASLPAGRFRLEYRSARLDAGPGTPGAARDRVRQALTDALPEGYTLLALSEAGTNRPDAADSVAYRLSARRGPDGAALGGVVPPGTARRIIVTYAEARLGPVQDRLSERPSATGAPAGWEPAALTALDALARIPEGEVQLAPRRIRLTGRVTAPAEAGRIHRRMAREAPTGYAAETALTVDLPARAAAVAPTAARCAWLLNGVIAERPIVFEPGETTLDAGSDAVLDRLAVVLSRCEGGRIEIGGHTDSRGPEDLNQRLSRQRAEVVLDALIERGVPLARLGARGYGEDEPVASNATEAGRAKNRRIGFKALPCRTRQAAC